MVSANMTQMTVYYLTLRDGKRDVQNTNPFLSEQAKVCERYIVRFVQSTAKATAVSRAGPAPDQMQSLQMMLPSVGDHPAQASGHSATHSKKVLVALGTTMKIVDISNAACIPNRHHLRMLHFKPFEHRNGETDDVLPYRREKGRQRL